MARGGMISLKKLSNFRIFYFFILLQLNFLCYYSSKRQSEHSVGTLKGSRNIQGFALIRAVLFTLEAKKNNCLVSVDDTKMELFPK